jgi:dihydrofolate reductase
MGTVLAVENVSLDGVMQSPGRPDEDTRGGFDRGGWASAVLAEDPEAAQAAFAGGGSTGAMLFGRRTYLDLVGFWLGNSAPNPFTELLRSTPKYVVSTTLTDPLPFPASHLIDGRTPSGIEGAVAGLKHEVEGSIVVLGSGQLVRFLAAAGLVDEWVLTQIPVVLGSGTRLFDGTPMGLEVVRSFTSPRGVVVGHYRVADA